MPALGGGFRWSILEPDAGYGTRRALIISDALHTLAKRAYWVRRRIVGYPECPTTGR
jgi:hypothetical protein